MAAAATRVVSVREQVKISPTTPARPDEGTRPVLNAASPDHLDSKWGDDPYFFAFAVSEPLPQVDLAEPLIRRLLPSGSYKRFVFFMRLHFQKFALVYRLGAVPSFIALFFVENTTIRTVLSLAVIVCSPSIVTSGLCLSTDMLVLLTRSYEFWFLVTINALNWIVIAWILDDIRALACLSPWFGLQTAIFMDANYRTFPNTVYSTTVSTPVVVIIAGLVAARVIVNANYFTIRIQTRVIGNAADLIAFSTTTLVLFLIRILLLRKTHAKQDARGMKTIPCVVLKATLRLTPLSNGVHVQPLSQKSELATASDLRQTKQRLSLAYVPLDRIDVRQTLLPPRIWLNPPRWILVHADQLRRVFYSIGGTAILLLVVDTFSSFYATLQSTNRGISFAERASTSLESPALVIPIVSSVMTTVFCGTFVLFYQRDLARFFVRDFDFVFSTLQTLAFIACLCDMHYWDLHRCITVTTWWIWFMWVLSLDALTPPINNRIFRLRKKWTAPMLASMIITSASTGLMVLFVPGLGLRNRVVWHHKFATTGVEFTVHTQSVLLGRVITICLWCTRQAFLRLTRRDDELIMIRGGFEYVSGLTTFPWRSRRKMPAVGESSGRNTSRNAVFPLPPLALKRWTVGPIKPSNADSLRR